MIGYDASVANDLPLTPGLPLLSAVANNLRAAWAALRVPIKKSA